METMSGESAYFTKGNILHPGSATEVAAAEVKARADIAAHHGPNGTAAAVTGGKIIKA